MTDKRHGARLERRTIKAAGGGVPSRVIRQAISRLLIIIMTQSRARWPLQLWAGQIAAEAHSDAIHLQHFSTKTYSDLICSRSKQCIHPLGQAATEFTSSHHAPLWIRLSYIGYSVDIVSLLAQLREVSPARKRDSRSGTGHQQANKSFPVGQCLTFLRAQQRGQECNTNSFARRNDSATRPSLRLPLRTCSHCVPCRAAPGRLRG